MRGTSRIAIKSHVLSHLKYLTRGLTELASTSMNAFVTSLLGIVVGILTHPLAAITFIGVEVAFAPDDLAVAFKRQDVRGQAVEEPAIVRRHHDSTGEIFDRLLEGP